MEKYSLILNSDSDKSKTIGIIQNKRKDLIDIEVIEKKEDIKKSLKTKYDIIPIFYKEENQNIRIYIAAQSGSGKTTLTLKILKEYNKIYPKQKIYLFTTLPDDPVYDEDKVIKKLQKKDMFVKYVLSEDNVELLKEITEEDLKNSICIFDDHLLFNKPLNTVVDSLKDIILKRGRHYDISSIIINDKLMSGIKSITELNQANYIITFPFCTNRYQLNGLYERYLGLDKNQIGLINSIETRYMVFNKIYPKYALHQHGVQLLTN